VLEHLGRIAMAALDMPSLESNGITFSRKVMGLEDLRETLGYQAEILAEGLLDFRQFAPQKKADVKFIPDLHCRKSIGLTRRLI
jgi:hypothetical protein